MKNKYLVILFILFALAVALSLFLNNQGRKADLVSEEIQKEAEALSGQVPAPSFSITPQAQNQTPVLTETKTGITVLNPPPVLQQPVATAAVPSADKASNNVSTAPAQTENTDTAATGITEIGKRPSPKEAQEMNSRGIVLY